MAEISFEDYLALQGIVFEWADSYDNKVRLTPRGRWIWADSLNNRTGNGSEKSSPQH